MVEAHARCAELLEILETQLQAESVPPSSARPRRRNAMRLRVYKPLPPVGVDTPPPCACNMCLRERPQPSECPQPRERPQPGALEPLRPSRLRKYASKMALLMHVGDSYV